MEHDYGLKEEDEFKATLGWKKKKFKKVVLTNVHLAKNRITVDKVDNYLKSEFLFPQWSRKQAFWLVKAIAEATGKTADITQMFSCEFWGDDGFEAIGLLQENIKDKLMKKLFKIDYEKEDVIAVKLKLKVIFL